MIYSNFFDSKTKREKILFAVLLISLGLLLLNSFLPSLHESVKISNLEYQKAILELEQNQIAFSNIQNYLNDPKNKDTKNTLERLNSDSEILQRDIDLINSLSLTQEQAIATLNPTLPQNTKISIDSQNNYQIKLEGVAEFSQIAKILDSHPIMLSTQFLKLENLQNNMVKFEILLVDKSIFELPKPSASNPKYSIDSLNAPDKFYLSNYDLNALLNLETIFNNQAKINKKWLKIGEKISGYELISIDAKSALLKRDKHQIKLVLGWVATK